MALNTHDQEHSAQILSFSLTATEVVNICSPTQLDHKVNHNHYLWTLRVQLNQGTTSSASSLLFEPFAPGREEGKVDRDTGGWIRKSTFILQAVKPPSPAKALPPKPVLPTKPWDFSSIWDSLLPWNFPRETKKVVVRFTFKVWALDISIQALPDKMLFTGFILKSKYHLKLAKLNSSQQFWVLIKHLLYVAIPLCRNTCRVDVLVKPQTRVSFSSSCLGVFTSLVRNVLHFLDHLNPKLSKNQAEPKNANKPWGWRHCKMACVLRL